jgi:ornithine carbamoyltransferase
MKQDFISIQDYTPAELQSLLDLAVELKKQRQNGGNPPLLRGKVLGMIFQKPSLRTRVSFDMAMRHLGGDALYLSPNEIGLGQRESVADVARVLAGYVDILMARVFAHDHILQLAQWASIPVINGLSDYDHPCQGMADALTIIEKFGAIKDLNVVFVGDGNNVAVSLLHIVAKLGGNFTHTGPAGYAMSAASVELGRQFAAQSGAKVSFTPDVHAAVKGAHVIYTDTWTSMGQEAETALREKVFPPYQVNAALVAEADKDAIVMHCLPAHRNHEITDEVADGPHSVLFPQAHNRLHAQKAVIARIMGVA